VEVLVHSRLLPLALIAVAAPCAGQVESRPATVQVPRDLGTVDLKALAREVDPGKVTPLRDVAPGWLVERLDRWTAPSEQAAKPASLVDELKSLMHRLENLSQESDTEQNDIGPLAAAVWRLDRVVHQADVPPAVLALAEQFYGLGYAVTSFLARFREVNPWQPFFAGALQDVPDLSLAQVRELRAFDDKLRTHFWRMTRKTGARILRSGTPAAAVPRVLADLSGLLSEMERFDSALRYRELAVQRSRQADASDWITLGRRYAAMYLTAEATAALSKAKAADPGMPPHKLAEKLRSLRDAIAAASRVGELQAPSSTEEHLEKARHLSTLGHNEAAIDVLDGLSEDRPKDARPLAALAKMAICDGAFTVASGLLERAKGLENHDATYYGVKLISSVFEFGTLRRAAGGGKGDLRPVAELLRDETLPLIRQLKKLGVERMDILEFGVATMVEGIYAVLDASKEEQRAWRTKKATVVGALGDRWPDDLEVRHFALAATIFREDLAVARRDLQKPLPAHHADAPDLATGRVAAYLATVEDPAAKDFENGLEAVLRDLPEDSFVRPLALGTHHALVARRRNDDSEWQQAERHYRQALESAPKPKQALLWNNLGVALAEQGQAQAARAAFQKAEQSAGDKKHLPAMNQLLTGPPRGDAELLGALLARDEPEPCELAWVVHLARGLGKDATARVRSQELLGQIHAAPILPHLELGHLGVVSGGVFSWGMRAGAAGVRFQCQFDVKLWLVRPAPISLLEIQKLAKRE
jgi:tetratricopeptide (TPR) repeat protein